MKKNLSTLILLIATCAILIPSCKKKDDNGDTTPQLTPAKKFLNLTFSSTQAYFSTDGSMTAAVDSNQAKLISSKIDITFIFDFDYTEPGFLDPKTRSQVWGWNQYYKPWLSNAVETRFYSTGLTKAQFDAAASDQSNIATYFSGSSFVLAPHAVFPTGSCIGGRQTSSPTSVLLYMGTVYGFKNISSGKRGLIYIRVGQETGWPTPIYDNNTYVDIIREV